MDAGSHGERNGRPAARASGLFEQLGIAATKAPPGSSAIVDPRDRLSYSELLRAASEFADDLVNAGVQPGDRVALILANRTDFLIAAFGIWKRGAIVLPLSPQLVEAELRGYLLDGSVRALATAVQRRPLVEALRRSGISIAHALLSLGDVGRGWIDDVAGELDRDAHSCGMSQVQIDGAWPAVTQYSTGSTGQPKRITRTHAQLIGESLSVADTLALTPEDRILGAAPFFHSYGLLVAALTTLLSGATLYPVESFVPSRVARLIESERVTGLPAVPTMFQLLCELNPPHDLSSLRYALSAGSKLADKTAESFQERFGLRIRQLYGSTETGVICIADENEPPGEASSVGYPIAGVSVAVVDDHGRDLPAEHVGLVQVSSQFSASDYDNPVSNSESYFVAGHFFPGDLGKLCGAGRLLLCGRRRGFINVNGLKVDPAEVESVILQLPGVTEAVVLGIADAISGEAVKAVLVSSDGCSAELIRAHCAKHLAVFKCPRIIEFRTELPRNSLGKLLKQALV